MDCGVQSAGLGFSAAERDAYARDGYIVRTGVMRPEEIEALRNLVEVVIAGVIARAERPGAGPQFSMADGHRMQFSSSTVIQWEWADGSRAVRLIEPFTHLHTGFERLWDDVRFTAPMRDALSVEAVGPYTCKLNFKRPGEGSEFPWHQDYTYWYAFTPETADEIATAILFLDDADANNGALRILAGSHRRGPARRNLADPTRFPRRSGAARPVDRARHRGTSGFAADLPGLDGALLDTQRVAAPTPRDVAVVSTGRSPASARAGVASGTGRRAALR